MHFTSHAIILKRIPYGEADQIVTFFSREEGRLSGIAASAKKSLKRFGGGLEPGSIVDLMFSRRPSTNLVRLESLHVVQGTASVLRSLERIEAMAEALELALHFVQEGAREEQKFDLLKEYLTLLSHQNPPIEMKARFLYQWLKFSGYEPPSHLADAPPPNRRLLSPRSEAEQEREWEQAHQFLLEQIEEIIGKTLRSHGVFSRLKI
ncbi:MAG: DNA repair protein RecO [Deltaproteobacteria bacterium]|nr:DNA repair protein RecO [Deltaproteobacteria bacterium]